VIFTVPRNRFPRWNETAIAMYSRRTGKRTILIEGGPTLATCRLGIWSMRAKQLVAPGISSFRAAVIPDLSGEFPQAE
jgi:hypothetical protein